jgi:hypothetical protein
MNLKVFNACLLAGWFLVTLGAVLYRADLGLVVAGIALVAITMFLALRFGVFQDAKPPKVDPNLPHEDAKRSNGLNVETLRLK